MGLTRIRAAQISDIDYKQAVRVITLSNITLSGGAPATVDGVSLVADDRILVAGQTTGSQNGLYYVSSLGTGSDGTWTRTTDGNETGEIQPGMIVMVTEGTSYADTQWKLVTNGDIIIGTTSLSFEQNSAFAFGNIYANGTAVLATSVGDAVTFDAGDNIAITGNNTSKTVTIGVTGISLNSISNGTSNVNVISSGGNVTVGIGGTNDIALFSTLGLEITGRVTATDNVVGGNILTSGLISAIGNITGDNIFGNGAGLSGINIFSSIEVAGETTVTADAIDDALIFAEGSGIAITTDAANNTITFSTAATDSIFATGGDMGTITEAVTTSEDLGLVTDAATVQYDLGTLVTSGIIYPDSLVLPSKTVADLANISASPAGQFVFCSDESGGSIPAFSDGTNWRRVTDRAIVT